MGNNSSSDSRRENKEHEVPKIIKGVKPWATGLFSYSKSKPEHKPFDRIPAKSKYDTLNYNAVPSTWNYSQRVPFSSSYGPFNRPQNHRPPGIGAIPHKQYPALEQPMDPPQQPCRGVAAAEIPSSYSLWNRSYMKYKMNSDTRATFDSRIQNNTDNWLRETENEAHRISMDIVKQTSQRISGMESNKPKLSLYSCIDTSEIMRSARQNDLKIFSPKPSRPELTPKMIEMIRGAAQAQPANELLAELDGAEVLRKDIQTLLGLNWLNDEIINAYMNLIVQRGRKKGYRNVHAFNTFFYPKLRDSGYNSIKRWTRKIDIFSFDYVLVPVHLGNHWCLAVIDFTRPAISYFDSLGGYPNGCCDILLGYLKQESKDKRKVEFENEENWRLIDKYHEEGIPQQKNCSDCGVFACTYAEYLTREAKLDFSQEHMPYFRKKMIYEIITKSILE